MFANFSVCNKKCSISTLATLMVQSCTDSCTIHMKMDLALNTRDFEANLRPHTKLISWKMHDSISCIAFKIIVLK